MGCLVIINLFMPGAKPKITDIGEPKSENGDMGVHKFVSIK